MANIVVLLTDFGLQDNFVGVMKGVILNIDPSITLVDLCHEIKSFDLISASYSLYSAWDYFPVGTVFLAVVDPGVGSNRNEIIALIDDKYYVGPDNGIISLLFVKKKNIKVFSINRDAVLNISKCRISSTFHGRDIFAPASAMIIKYGIKSVINYELKPVLLDSFDVVKNKNILTGRVIHIDKYGNCITSIQRDHISDLNNKAKIKFNKKNLIIETLNQYYEQVKTGKLIVYWGSSDFLEIAVRNKNASEKFKLKLNDIIYLET